MAKSLIRLEIVTPGGVVYSEEVEHAVIPTANGKIDILQHHAPLIDRLVPADVKVVDRDKKVDYLAIGSGFVEVYAEKIYIITDQAILVNEDDDAEIEEAIKRAEEALEKGKDSNFDEAQLQVLEAAAKFEQARKLAKGKTR
ncbi:MAG: ATP synthase F1 subunit epsilon [Verrucomicrobiota bacterium]|nr:ATP synthase F1 subunit epsilon [Verrucomicrobiota bacterium]